MAAPVKTIMDNLYVVRESLVDDERFEEANVMDTLIEAANRAGHEVYTWDGVADAVRKHVAAVRGTLHADTLEFIELSLEYPVDSD